MFQRTQNDLKRWFKKFCLLIFLILFFMNIKLMLTDEKNLISGDLSIFGISVNLFEPTFAKEERPCDTMWCAEVYSCISDGEDACAYFLCNPGPGGFYCYFINPDKPV